MVFKTKNFDPLVCYYPFKLGIGMVIVVVTYIINKLSSHFQPGSKQLSYRRKLSAVSWFRREMALDSGQTTLLF